MVYFLKQKTMIKWSFSSIKQYKTCPKQYYEVRVAKNFTSRDSADSIYGKEVHKALEDYVRDGVPLAKNYEQFKRFVDPLLDIRGDKYCEHEMAVTINKVPCEFSAEEYWVRGIVDLLIVDEDTAFIVDYKTGKSTYADTNQLKLMAAMVFAHFPAVNKIKSGLMFLLSNSFLTEEYTRADLDKLWATFDPDLMRLSLAFENSIWPPSPTGLCRRHCPVETCKFYGGR